MNRFPWQFCCQVNSQTKVRHEGKQKAKGWQKFGAYRTHPSLSPASLLPSLVFSLGKICKSLWSLCECSDCPCLSLFYPSSTSSPQHSRARRLLLCCTRTSYPRLSNGSPLIFQPSLLLLCLFSLCSAALLFSAFLPCCLPWHRLPFLPFLLLTLLPPLSHFCL